MLPRAIPFSAGPRGSGPVTPFPSRMFGIAALVVGSVAWGAPARAASGPDPALIQQGEYLARAGDCVACHTGPGGKPFAGGLVMRTPFGSITTPNITPDKATGIGDWSDDDFYRALHEGIGKKLGYLYPVFPFPWYTKVTREDALAIKAYLFSLPPENAPRKPYRLSFPFNIREALLSWRTAFFKPATFKPDPAKSPEVNRGAYLVEGLGHCGECHNHNNVLGASDWSGRLRGGEIDGWYAPNITADGKEGIGAWSEAELVTFLREGSAPGRGVALGPMKETIEHSLRYLSDADLQAIAAYLKSFSAQQSYKPLDAAQQQAVSAAGAPTYLSFCASCHGVDGKGRPGMIPALAGNGAVTAQGPQNMIRVVVGGLPATNGLSPMPAVGVGMSDQEVADAVNYARTAWGNAAPGNAAPGLVAKLRAETSTLMSATPARGCPAPTADPVLAKAVAASGLDATVGAAPLANLLEPIDDVLGRIKAAAPAARDDDIVNAVAEAYCPVAMADATLTASERTVRLGDFAVLVYGQLKQGENGPIKN